MIKGWVQRQWEEAGLSLLGGRKGRDQRGRGCAGRIGVGSTAGGKMSPGRWG